MTEAKTPRLAIVDIARGVAIIFMAIYHLSWDLWNYQFILADVPYDPAWVLFARSILSVFLFLAGVGLVLGHGNGIRWQRFWRRWLYVVAGALAITVATFFAFPDSFVYFGVLHAIALFSLLGLAFVRTPIWLAVGVAIIVIALPFFFSAELFNLKQLSWLGFWQIPPITNDLVPVFPWFAAVLLGIVAARLVLRSRWIAPLAAIRAEGRLGRSLAFMGRWSLLIYLLHQPILLAVIAPAAAILKPEISNRAPIFLRDSQFLCEQTGTSADLCVVYSQCKLEGIEQNNLWDAINSGVIFPSQQKLLDDRNFECSSLVNPDLQANP